jgi:peptidoglycan hydrolase CwlO-like protein
MAGTGLDALDMLEQRIEKAAHLIEQLRGEKKATDEENKRLKEELQSLYISNEELTRQLKHLTTKKDKKEDTEKTREEIAEKIEEMLAKLEELNI